MKLQIIRSGVRFTILALDLSDGETANCPALQFLEGLPEASRKSLTAVLQLHAATGPLRNTEKSRPIKGTEGIWEFKSRQGDRLLFFYPKGERGVTILTNGFHKGAPVKVEARRAQALMDQYYAWRSRRGK
ncbi:MAG: type II toxin-antitoxin system RelE/ParE family toxin [Chloroflexi bacterium]|nr:type II toxin-antitoxin system RelE/ParE family toxin [Chloroflexota bacterium]